MTPSNFILQNSLGIGFPDTERWFWSHHCGLSVSSSPVMFENPGTRVRNRSFNRSNFSSKWCQLHINWVDMLLLFSADNVTRLSEQILMVRPGQFCRKTLLSCQWNGICLRLEYNRHFSERLSQLDWIRSVCHDWKEGSYTDQMEAFRVLSRDF